MTDLVEAPIMWKMKWNGSRNQIIAHDVVLGCILRLNILTICAVRSDKHTLRIRTANADAWVVNSLLIASNHATRCLFPSHIAVRSWCCRRLRWPIHSQWYTYTGSDKFAFKWVYICMQWKRKKYHRQCWSILVWVCVCVCFTFLVFGFSASLDSIY